MVEGVDGVHDCSTLRIPPKIWLPRLKAMFVRGRVGTTCPLPVATVSRATVAHRSAGTAKHDGIQLRCFRFCPLGGGVVP